VLKGLQGEIEEVLGNISLSVSVLKGLFQAYDFCCANMKLFFKVPVGSWSLGLSATVAASSHSPSSLPLPSKRTGRPCRGNSLHPSPSPE
jgi:hypothetical protein